MKIQSKFKDYYDFVSTKFGQDPDCVYVRKSTQNGFDNLEWPTKEDYFRDTINKTMLPGRRGLPRAWNPSPNSAIYMEFIVAGPHVVAFIRRNNKLERLTKAHEPILGVDWKTSLPMYPKLPSGKDLEELIRLVGAPVFHIREQGHSLKKNAIRLLIDDRVPVLADLGFASIVPAEQMWQDIYSTMINVLRKNPDKAPPVQVAEKYRIEEAGFDLKTSFRHPVNQKAPKPVKKSKK